MSSKNWALIFGGSSGIGNACAYELARKGFHLIIIHRDGRIATKSFNEQILSWKTEYSVQIHTLNININTTEGKEELKSFLQSFDKKSIKIFIHSIADGHVKPLFSKENETLSEEDLQYTINSMGISFATWTQWLFREDLLASNAKVFSFTSMGSHRTIPHYAAVGAAKAVLETLCRYMAYELAPYGITVNLLCPGVVQTKAIRVFPEVEKFIEEIKIKNPYHRLTTSEDVAKLLVQLIDDNVSWLNGQIIPIDGGEGNVY
ncbi:MAG: SDR family oxidoreductase [Bacteroidales bacterium]|nr:SDR family oxidoreductase [Bacteroidales bacterium]